MKLQLRKFILDRKGYVSVTKYFGKLRSITDKLAITRSPAIYRLGQPYFLVTVFNKANVLKMSVNKAYSILLTHEARLESGQSNASKEAKLNYVD